MLNTEQIKYLNSVALQHIMNLDPEYDESRKREIYAQTIHALVIELSEEYWRLQRQSKGN